MTNLGETFTEGLIEQVKALTAERDGLKVQLTEAKKVIGQCENAIQKVAGINDESRLGWALQAIESFNNTFPQAQEETRV